VRFSIFMNFDNSMCNKKGFVQSLWNVVDGKERLVIEFINSVCLPDNVSDTVFREQFYFLKFYALGNDCFSSNDRLEVVGYVGVKNDKHLRPLIF
jgi:hypothetical protein